MHGQGAEPPRANKLARVRLFSFLPRGISRLTLEMTTRTFGFKAEPSVGRDALVPPHSVYDCSRFYCRGFLD